MVIAWTEGQKLPTKGYWDGKKLFVFSFLTISSSCWKTTMGEHFHICVFLGLGCFMVFIEAAPMDSKGIVYFCCCYCCWNKSSYTSLNSVVDWLVGWVVGLCKHLEGRASSRPEWLRRCQHTIICSLLICVGISSHLHCSVSFDVREGNIITGALSLDGGGGWIQDCFLLNVTFSTWNWWYFLYFICTVLVLVLGQHIEYTYERRHLAERKSSIALSWTVK